jgi:hypothetical protein
VSQVRLQPVVTQNVVTYITMIEVPNDGLELKPGMTANARIEIARRSNVLRVPVSAMRFRATPEVFQMLKLPVHPGAQRNGGSLAAAAAKKGPAANEMVRATAGAAGSIADRGATTIDALFGDLVFDVNAVRVWTYAVHPTTKLGRIDPIDLRTGLSDGTYAELIGPGVEEGKMLLTGVMLPQKSTAPTGSGNPLMPGQRRQGDHGPGGFGGPH